MTDRVALVLAALILAALALDFWLFGAAGGLFVLRKLSQLVDYLIFWR